MAASTSSFAIIKTDYPSFLLAIAPAIFGAATIGAAVFGALPGRRGRGTQEVDDGFVWILAAGSCVLAVVLGILLWKRLQGIQEVLVDGEQATGEIVRVLYPKDKVQLTYRFEAGGEPYEVVYVAMKNAASSKVGEGDEVLVRYDPEDPNRSYLPAVFG